MLGEIYKDTPISLYQPSQEISDLTAHAKKEFTYGWEILHRPWPELNDYSVIDRMEKDKRTFNSFVDESVQDPNEAWKWKGTRSMARNRTIGMHAHITAQYVVPMVTAQNESQEEDREMSDVGRDILEWMTVNSNYRPSFLLATMGMLVNPVTYMGAEYCEVYQKIKELQEDGTLTTKEILDEVFSGFQAPVYTADQILITNAYEQNIQKQRAIFKRRYIDYTEAEAKYKDHPNWDFVRPGVRTIFNAEDNLFYEVQDHQHPFQLEEVIYLNRRDDTEVCFLNGIYMGDENVDANPVKHRDNRGAPKYNVVPFGYERITEHFFYYKSLINRVGWDDQLLDALYQVGMNQAILNTLMPIVVTGQEKVDTEVVFPGAIVAFADKDATAKPLLPPANLNTMFSAMKEVEGSMAEGSISNIDMGQLPSTNQRAYVVAAASQNAKIILAGVGKTLGQSVAMYGDLMIDIALQHLTTVQVDEITGAEKYRPFILKDQMVNGKKVSKHIRFDETLMGKDMTAEEKKYKSIDLLTKVGYPDNKEHLYLVNPFLFSKMKYLVRVEPEMMEEKNKQFEKTLADSMYTKFRMDPLVEPEALVRYVIQTLVPEHAEELVAKQPAVMASAQPGQPQPAPAPGAPQPNPQPGPQSQMGAQAGQKQIGNALAGMVH